MLFDLRGRGRRRTIKFVYITLAVLMGGGLVFFGIGGDVSGGLVDAITERGSGTDDGTKRLKEQEAEALAATERNPADAAAWASLIRARYSQSKLGDNFDASKGTYTAAGKAKLEQAADAWEQYQRRDPPVKQAAEVARIVKQVYGALGKPEEMAAAQEIVAEANPTDTTYAQLAELSYAAGQKRKGDLAKDKALELSPKDEREALRGQLETAASQAAGAGAGAETPPVPVPSPEG